MAKPHDWQYKRAGESYIVLCAECTKVDSIWTTDEGAKARRKVLLDARRAVKMPKMGMNRRARQTRRMQKQADGMLKLLKQTAKPAPEIS